MPSRSAIVRVGLGLLLIAAAGLKLYGLGVSAVPQVGWFAQPWVQLAVTEWELVLGLWLISGASARLSWWAALVTFAAFAAVSGYLGSIGVASCGCFGTIQASPWWAFGVDVGALLLLALASPPKVDVITPAPPLRFVICTVFMLGTVLVIATARYGSLHNALASFYGGVTVSPRYLDLGRVSPNTTVEATVCVSNWSDEPVRIVGGSSDCSCVVAANLPLDVPARDSRDVQIRFTVPAQGAQKIVRNIRLTIDHKSIKYLVFWIGCESD